MTRRQEREYETWIDADLNTSKAFLDEEIKLGDKLKHDTQPAPSDLLERLGFIVGVGHPEPFVGDKGWRTWADISKHLKVWIQIDIENGHFEGGIPSSNLPENVAIPYGPGGYKGLSQ